MRQQPLSPETLDLVLAVHAGMVELDSIEDEALRERVRMHHEELLRTADAEALLGELRAASPRRYVSPYRLALVHIGLGNVDAAFAALEAAYDERAVGIVNLVVEPRFDPLRSDARFTRLLRRLGLEN